MKTQSGFTLVEVLVTGVLSSIVAGALVSMLSMVNLQMNAGIAENRLGRIQTVVSEQIRASARKSWGILQSGDIIDDTHHFPDLAAISSTSEIILSDKNGNPMVKYHIDNSGMLWEWHDGDPGDYYPFAIGKDTVHVDAAHSDFTLAQGRKNMTFKLAYTLEGKTLPIIQEAIQCRNLAN
jgi:prepilin-type N-terminal cleavage/methylation domain-containing protein